MSLIKAVTKFNQRSMRVDKISLNENSDTFVYLSLKNHPLLIDSYY